MSIHFINLSYKMIEEFKDVKEAEIEISYYSVQMFDLLGKLNFSSVSFPS